MGLGGGVEKIKRKKKVKEKSFGSSKACGSENLSKRQ